MQCREAIQARRGVVGWNRRRDSNSDTTALVSGKDSGGIGGDGRMGGDHTSITLPPEWVDTVEEVQYTLTRISARIKELSQLHENHISRPTFDDSMEEEQAIEILTQEITKLFQKCQKEIKGIGGNSMHLDGSQEGKVARNVKSSLASRVQDLSSNFRKDQSTYLKRKYFEKVNLTFLCASLIEKCGFDQVFATENKGKSSILSRT